MKKLIEKYFNGETSIHEEAELKAYFSSGHVDESLSEYVSLFQFLEEGKQLELGADFDEKLFARIDSGENGITDLVDKYFNGNTSLDEETTLKSYFNSGEVTTTLKQYQPLFQFFENEKEVALNSNFDDKLFAKIEGGAKVVQMRVWQRKLLRIAAAVVVLLSAYFFLDKPLPPTPPTVNWSAYEINDEQLAYDETVKALKLLSSKLNKAKNKTVHEMAKSEPVSKYLN